MAEQRRRTLLDFAIAASVAVVPVLLIVLLVVGVLRPADPLTVARIGDRHVSVRQVAALKTFERAIVRRGSVAVGPPSAILILDRVPQCRSAWDGHAGPLDRLRGALASGGVPAPSPAQRLSAQLTDLDFALQRFSTGANRRVSESVGFDAARWFDAVTRVLEAPIEAGDYPGRRFTVQCADIVRAASLLARSNGRILAALSWRGTEVARVVSRWRPDQFVEISTRQLARANPWLGMASGERSFELSAELMPFSIGRSRNQALVIDRAHEGVSGHHVDITAIDDDGATVLVHGDNGVSIEGVSHPAGARLRWKPGDAMILGRVVGREPECRVTWSRGRSPWTS